MGWRVVVVASNAKVDDKMDYLVVRTLDVTKRIHLSEISVLMLESTAISITAYAIAEMLKRKIKIIFCDRERNPCGEIMALHGSHDTCAKIRQQIRWTEGARQMVWTELVREKIRGQREILAAHHRPQAALLTEYMKQVELNDSTNREGHAAKVYFNALFGMGFTRTEENLVNAALNYGYSILLSAINREITAAGYLTALGIFHDNTFNAFNLGCGFMEPLRPMVDQRVMQLELKKFEHEEKMQLVSLLNEEVQFGGKTHYLSYALRLYCQGLFSALQSGNPEDIRMIQYEL